MRAEDLNYQSFVAWAAVEPSRTIKIMADSNHAEVIVGQYLLNDDTGRREYVCQVVDTVAEIDLEVKFGRQREEAREQRRAKYESMKAEFGG